MAAHTITSKGQVTIPKSIRDACGLLPGTPVAFEAHDGIVILRAQRLIDADQAWYWTPEWQEAIAEAEEDIKAGRTLGPFDNPEDLIAALHKGWPDDKG